MKIEKNIPIPGVNTGKYKYPWKSMDVGDSIFVPEQKILGGAYSSAKAYGRKFGKKFSARSVDSGIRIWRIK